MFLFLIVATLASKQASWVEYKGVQNDTRGYKVVPDQCTAESKCPGYLILHDGDGLTEYEMKRACMAADRGYVVFVGDIYGSAFTDQEFFTAISYHIRVNPAAYAMGVDLALGVLRGFSEVDSQNIITTGYCFGGIGASKNLYTGDDVLAGIGYHPNIVTFMDEPMVTTGTGRNVLFSGATDANDHMNYTKTLMTNLETAGIPYQIVRFGANVQHCFTKWDSDSRTGIGCSYDETADLRSWQLTEVTSSALINGFTPEPQTMGLDPASFTFNDVEYDYNGSLSRGYVAYPNACTAQSPCPAVVVLPNWEGIGDYEKTRTEMIAKLGYVGLGADIYGVDTPVGNFMQHAAAANYYYENKDIYVDKIKTAIDVAKGMSNVDASKIVVVGYCFGGTGAISLAIDGTDILGVVSYHGTLTSSRRSTVDLQSPTPITTKILTFDGFADSFESNEYDVLEAELEAAGANYEINFFGPYVGHDFTNAARDSCEEGLGFCYDAAADYYSWEQSKLFFEEVFTDVRAQTGPIEACVMDDTTDAPDDSEEPVDTAEPSDNPCSDCVSPAEYATLQGTVDEQARLIRELTDDITQLSSDLLALTGQVTDLDDGITGIANCVAGDFPTPMPTVMPYGYVQVSSNTKCSRSSPPRTFAVTQNSEWDCARLCVADANCQFFSVDKTAENHCLGCTEAPADAGPENQGWVSYQITDPAQVQLYYDYMESQKTSRRRLIEDLQRENAELRRMLEKRL